VKTMKELKTWILEDPEERLKYLKLGDEQALSYAKNPETFILPAAYAPCEAVVATFFNEPLGYAKWLRKFRDDYFERGSDGGKFLSELAAHIEPRGMNKRVRLVEEDAILSAQRSGKLASNMRAVALYKLQLRRRLKAERQERLKSARARTQAGRLSTEERSEITLAFWDDVAQRAAAGEFDDI